VTHDPLRQAHITTASQIWPEPAGVGRGLEPVHGQFALRGVDPLIFLEAPAEAAAAYTPCIRATGHIQRPNDRCHSRSER
jgi:hypothetical protein